MRDVYETLVAHGAPKILIDAHPHIGSNPQSSDGDAPIILEAIGEVHFGEKVIHFKYCNHKKQLKAFKLNLAMNISSTVILATGHSA